MMATPNSSSSKSVPRRPAGHPKSSRQQFSACGACRIRRVRCDLKDLPESSPCSNCRDHGFNCVDEFREVKAVKLLRRGRRIQQVEAVYGAGSSPGRDQSQSSSRSPIRSKQGSIIPRLDPRFFDSRFYARFHIQRPIIEPNEFKARYTAFFQGDGEALGIPGQLIAMLFVTWAASYGVDECGREEPHDDAQGVRRRKRRTNEMVQELLHLIDIHGLPRKPSWDGVRVLLLIMPLTEEVAEPLERLTMYETAINQVYTLCSLASPRSVNSGQGDQVDALVRARIYWYAFVHEGITTGIRGGRLHLEDDDLAVFQTLQEGTDMPITRSELTLTYSRRWALAPLRLASACRRVNSALTGSKARGRQNVDDVKLNEAWESIENCWEEFESLRQLGLLGIMTVEEADRFVDGWKIFIFECHNVIREFLKERLVSASGDGNGPKIIDSEDQEATFNTLVHLHTIAESKCQDIIQHVVFLVRRHLGTSFFEYDASLVRDGCFFAGYMLAGEDGTDEQMDTCLRALSEMRWAFSKSEERIQKLKLIREDRQTAIHRLRDRVANKTPQPSDPPPEDTDSHTPTAPSHGPPDDRLWGESSDRQDSEKANSNPDAPPMSRPPDHERMMSFYDSSMSSESSTLFTDKPYAPTTRLVVTSPTHHSQYHSKPAQVPHDQIPYQRRPERLLADPSVGLEFETTCSNEGCYQGVEPVYPDLTQHPGVDSEQQDYVGSDGLLHLVYSAPICDADQGHPPQGHNYPYPDNTPYSYS